MNESSRPVALRDDAWLESRLRALQETYFQDVPAGYPIRVQFGRRAKKRFGSIAACKGVCRITINGLFRRTDVPEYVVDATLAHELAHYVHGFGSGLRRLHAAPHRGGVVDEELRKRGCFHLERQAKAWRESCWLTFYAAYAAAPAPSRVTTAEQNRREWDAYLNQPGFRTEDGLKMLLRRLANRFGLAEPPFQVAWLAASLRQTGLSYRFSRERMVRLHGLLANPRVPEAVLIFELACWLAMGQVGRLWGRIEQALKDAGLWDDAQQALHWRRYHWTRYRKAHHPLARR